MTRAVNAVGRAVVDEPSQAQSGPGDRTVRMALLKGGGRTRAVMPGQIGVQPDRTTLRQSIIVPTFNERDNIATLIERLAAVLPHSETEIVFVDDSTDDTPQVIENAARHSPLPIRVQHRDDPVGGLGGAVVDGMRIARGEWIVVMDADLQHPPEVVPDLIAAGMRDGADLVVGSRYTGAGSPDGLTHRHRKLVSRSATALVKTLFRHSLLQVSDPMSGLFAIRASSLEAGELRPMGYKILLELVIRNRPGRIVEVPYSFQPRHAGESKSSVAEGMRFVKHVGALRFGAQHTRMFYFALIGICGLLPNMATLFLLNSVFGVHYLPAAGAANVIAVLTNFALTDRLLYADRRTSRSLFSRFARFFVMGNADLLLRIPLLAVLVGAAHLDVLVANLVTLVASFVVRFFISDKVIYSVDRRKP